MKRPWSVWRSRVLSLSFWLFVQDPTKASPFQVSCTLQPQSKIVPHCISPCRQHWLGDRCGNARGDQHLHSSPCVRSSVIIRRAR